MTGWRRAPMTRPMERPARVIYISSAPAWAPNKEQIRMNTKQFWILLALLIAAAAIGRWRYHAYQQDHPANPLGTRVTFDYNGPVPGLFDMLTAKSGAHYKVNPALAQRSVSGSFKNKSVVQVQEF